MDLTITSIRSDGHAAYSLAVEPEPMAASNNSEQRNQELQLIQALRKGEEAAFIALINRYHSRLLRLARTFVPNQAVAEEVVQETWMKVLEGIKGFEGRSSLKTWIFKILTNRGKTSGIHERRYISFGDLGNMNDKDRSHEIGPEEFHTSGPFADHWAVAPISVDEMTPERQLLLKECCEKIEKALKTLSPIQQQVIILRDVEGIEPTDVCAMLHISEGNHRVLLHRARSKVRSFLDFSRV